ncbi:MAG: electron transfer flavoprotein subunit beta/FixA family protein [Chloroflexota bacterium]
MVIFVCIKQVPEELKVDARTGALVREGIAGVINPCDRNAIEMALLLRERHGGKVVLLTMGPAQAEDSLREGLAMGADEAALLCDRDFAGADTLATSYALAAAVRKMDSFDLIICGRETADSGTGHVGPQLAEHLRVPQVTDAVELAVEGRKLKARRALEREYEMVEADLPVLVTVPRGINQPRLPSFGDILEASAKPLHRWCASDLAVEADRIGLRGSPTRVLNVFVPEAKRHCQRLTGKAEEVAERLAAVLRERGLVPKR